MMKLDYRSLLVRFFSHEISDQEFEELKGWLMEDEKNRRIFDAENELWQELDFKGKDNYYKTAQVWENINKKAQLGNQKGKVLILERRSYIRVLIAATVAILIGVSGILFWMKTDRVFHEKLSDITTVRTNAGEKSHVLLSDSTEIFLNSSSEIKYTGRYNIETRDIALSGEAFFDVHTNPEKPFIVSTEGLKIIAKGTRFNILSYDEENRVEVTLEEGLMEVKMENEKPRVLRIGQQAIYNKESRKLYIRDVNVNSYLSWIDNKIKFIDTPLAEVILKIERNYNVQFRIMDNDLLSLKYTGTFIDEPIDEIMKMLAIVSPIHYSISRRTKEDDIIYQKPLITIWKGEDFDIQNK